MERKEKIAWRPFPACCMLSTLCKQMHAQEMLVSLVHRVERMTFDKGDEGPHEPPVI